MDKINNKPCDGKIEHEEITLLKQDYDALVGLVDKWQTYYYNECKHTEYLTQELAEKEKEVKKWRNLYNERDKQFQSVRQRYHLLNKLQSNYDKKDKLHLAYMQCAELVDENEKLKQELDKFKNALSISNLENLQVENMLLKGKAKDKIQFAINELEKVKTYIFEHKVMPFFEERYIVYAKSLNNQIIQQIENLQKEQPNHEN